jgi:hypothetical protein
MRNMTDKAAVDAWVQRQQAQRERAKQALPNLTAIIEAESLTQAQVIAAIKELARVQRALIRLQLRDFEE